MNPSISAAFEEAKSRNRKAFIPFLTAGFPNGEIFQQALMELDSMGSDVIEVGIPFSDPLADGPVIQWAGKQSLDRGTTTASAMDMVAQIRDRVHAPIVAMTYYNPILRMGDERFASLAARSGISGVIIPDLPPEEAEGWINAARNNGLDTIFLTAITSPKPRKEKIARLSSGFLYYVSMTGVTGASLNISQETLADIAQVRSMSDVPVAVGFGVSTPASAKVVASAADGVIVGSALIKRMIESQEGEEVKAMASLAGEMKSAMDERAA
jgi:tryptophan synthase alpha chain